MDAVAAAAAAAASRTAAAAAAAADTVNRLLPLPLLPEGDTTLWALQGGALPGGELTVLLTV
jgi:hypothetical protein